MTRTAALHVFLFKSSSLPSSDSDTERLVRVTWIVVIGVFRQTEANSALELVVRS